MNKLSTMSLCLLMTLLWTACKKDETTPVVNPPITQTTSTTVKGRILDAQGQALSGVEIQLGDATTQSSGDGSFSITGNVSGSRAVLQANKQGYMSRTHSCVLGAEDNTTIVMSVADKTASFAVSTGGTLTLSSGASVQIPASGVTLMDGSTYTGSNVSVAVQEINEDKGIAFSAMIPGNTLSAIDASGTTQELYSYGMLNVELSGDNGEALQLASGANSTLTFAIPTEQQADAPSTIPLWYYDEASGLWQEEGVATKQGNIYVGSVAHFTTWNCDQPHPPCTLSGCVVDVQGNPVVGMTLQVGQVAVNTGNDGCFSASVPAQFLPITVSNIDYTNMTSCLLYELTNVISPSANYSLGNLIHTASCNQAWDIDVPTSLLGVAGDTLPIEIGVRDSMGNGVAGVVIQANVLQGGGSVVSSSVSTDVQGVALVDWALGTVAVQELEVYVGSQRFVVVASPAIMGTMTDARDGNVYTTMTYPNGQTWMVENLRYDVPGVITTGAMIDTFNLNSPSVTYGRLYDWNTLMNGAGSSASVPSGVQGICPSGWHVPSDEEWKLLEKSLGMNQVDVDNYGWRGINQGVEIKSTSGWHWLGRSGNGSNHSGFNVFPAGDYYSGSFFYLERYAYLWSSTEHSSGHAWYRELYNHNSEVGRSHDQIKTNGFSCRCVED